MDVVELSERIIVFGFQFGWEESIPLIPDLKTCTSLNIIQGRSIAVSPLRA